MGIEAVRRGEAERRDRDLVREAVRLRGVPPDKLARAMDDLNSYVLKSAVIGIKARNPGITKSQLSIEIKKAFA